MHYMYIYVYCIYMYICTHTRIYIYYMYTYIYTYITCMYICTHVWVCILNMFDMLSHSHILSYTFICIVLHRCTAQEQSWTLQASWALLMTAQGSLQDPGTSEGPQERIRDPLKPSQSVQTRQGSSRASKRIPRKLPGTLQGHPSDIPGNPRSPREPRKRAEISPGPIDWD